MAHNLAQGENGNEVFASYREDAWHMLGTVFQDRRTATEAWNSIDHYNVAKSQMYYVHDNTMPFGEPLDMAHVDLNNITLYPTDVWGIARVDPTGIPIKTFGTVAKGYRLVTPDDFCKAWDVAGANWPIETIGALGNGEKMFVLSKLGEREINGDIMLDYVLGLNDMTGGGSNILKITRTRVVCQNTLDAALAGTESNFKVNHNVNVIDDMIGWISDVLTTAQQKADTLAQAMELLATIKLEDEQVTKCLQLASPVPAKPRHTGSPLYDSRKLEDWEERRDLSLSRQLVVRDLYNGAATGFNSETFPGTAWGMYNSAVEALDHVIPSRNTRDRAITAVDGWRATQKQSLFKYLIGLN